MLEVGHTATRLSCFAPVSRCCDGSARADSQTSKLPGSGVLATRYPDLSKPRVRAQAVPRPLPCSYGAVARGVHAWVRQAQGASTCPRSMCSPGLGQVPHRLVW